MIFDHLFEVLHQGFSQRRLPPVFRELKELVLSTEEGRHMFWFIVVAFFLVLCTIPNFVLKQHSAKELTSLRSRIKEFSVLSAEYKSFKVGIDAIEQKGSLKKEIGMAQAMDDILSSLGSKGKIKSIKGLGSREIKAELREESAEVQLEKVTMNEMINIFYRVENTPLMLSIKKVAIKKSFENPELLDITMTVSLFTKQSVIIK